MQAFTKVGLEALLTPANCVVLLIDHQPFQLANVNCHEPTMVINNVTALAKTAKAYGIPTILTSVNAVGSLDDAALSDYTRQTTFETVVGKVTFGEGGGWAEPRVLTVQFRDIKTNNISEFKKPDTEAVVYPSEAASASLIYPYERAKR